MNLGELHIGDIIIADGYVCFFNGISETAHWYYGVGNVDEIGSRDMGVNFIFTMDTPFTFIHSSVTDDVKYQ